MGDNPASEDSLGYSDYAEVLYRIIMDVPVIETPICIGIHGKWGSGKTSLMEQIKKKLDSKESRAADVRTVWFDAWKYAQTEVHWAALIQVVISEIQQDETLLEWLKETVEEELKDKAKRIFRRIGQISRNLGIAAIKGGLERIDKNLKLSDILDEKSPLEKEGEQKEAKTEFQKEIEFLTELKNAFRGVIKDYIGEEGKFVIFMDDLDRCTPENVIPILEAAKNYLDTQGCVFVMGVDQEAIEKGIEAHYGGKDSVEAFLKRDYVEKIIQLPFSLPPLTIDDIRERDFLSLIGAEDFKDYLNDLEMGVGLNPRKIKRLRNIYRLQQAMKEQKDLSAIEDHVLLKFLIVQYRWRDFYDDIVKHGKDLVQRMKASLEEYKKPLEESQYRITAPDEVQSLIYGGHLADPDLFRFLTETDFLSILGELDDVAWSQLINLSTISKTEEMPEKKEEPSKEERWISVANDLLEQPEEERKPELVNQTKKSLLSMMSGETDFS